MTKAQNHNTYGLLVLKSITINSIKEVKVNADMNFGKLMGYESLLLFQKRAGLRVQYYTCIIKSSIRFVERKQNDCLSNFVIVYI